MLNLHIHFPVLLSQQHTKLVFFWLTYLPFASCSFSWFANCSNTLPLSSRKCVAHFAHCSMNKKSLTLADRKSDKRQGAFLSVYKALLYTETALPEANVYQFRLIIPQLRLSSLLSQQLQQSTTTTKRETLCLQLWLDWLFANYDLMIPRIPRLPLHLYIPWVLVSFFLLLLLYIIIIKRMQQSLLSFEFFRFLQLKTFAV